MAPGSQPLSDDQMRRTRALVDILTSLKRRANHPPPTEELILRNFDALSLPALNTLSILIDHTTAGQHRRLSPRQVCGMSQAVIVFSEDTASEVAHVHACERVVSAVAVKRASLDASHVLRLGLEHLAVARERGIPLCPVATDRHLQAMDAFARGGRNDKGRALEVLGVGDANIPEDDAGFVSSNGLLTSTSFCIAVMDRLDLHGDICCGSCYQVVRADELSICRRCDDQLLCKGCLGHAKHVSECGRVRSMVRSMAQSLTPHIRESARRVAVVQLSESGLMVPMSTTSIASPLIPSSLFESLSRCSVVCPSGLQIYWRLLVSFLADMEGDEQEAIDYEGVHHVQAAEYAIEDDTQPIKRGAPKLVPSERRRIRKEMMAAGVRAKEEVRFAAEAAAIAEADAVLERQSARPDATSAMLTSVLAKRKSAASTEVVAHVRARRDSLRDAERMARKPVSVRPGRDLTERICRRVDLVDARPTAALILQRRVRAWLRCRKKARRKTRSRAAKRIQSSVRTWLLLRVEVKSLIAATAASSGSVGTDCEEQSVADEPESLNPASTEPTTAAECAICLDDDAEFAAVPCGHRCLCASCSRTVTHCPMCRAQMSAVLRIFI